MLKKFVLGKYKAEGPALEMILEHVADCFNCERQLAKIGVELETSKTIITG